MTQKNKIFSIILSLLVLGSVACRKSGGGNGGGVVTEPGTFSITEASGNVKALVVKPETTVSDIKIAFSSSADYTANFTVEDTAETVEANKITSEDFEFANNSLTAKATLVDKVRNLDSSSQAVEKTIKINFTFKAKDTTLKNNTKTLSIEVKLTKELAFKPSSLIGNWTFDGAGTAGNNTLEITESQIKVKVNGIEGTIDISTTWNDEKDKEVTVYEKSSEETDKGAVGRATHTVKFTSATTRSASVSAVKDGNTSVYDAKFTKQQ